jgi:hypothetical protein
MEGRHVRGLVRPRARYRRDHRGPLMAYVARVHHDETIRIYRDDEDRPVAVVMMSPGGVSLRTVLAEAGWRPTGRRARSGGWGAIYAERIEHR